MDEKQRVWNSVLGEIELNISKPQFNTWIKNTYPISMDETEIVICVSSAFTRNWLENKFNLTILNSIQKITGSVKKVRYVVQNTQKTNSKSIKSVINLKDQELQSQKEALSAKSISHGGFNSESGNNFVQTQRQNGTSLLKENYTFENFIVGSSNELAHAAAQSVANEPGTRYNPLFIYGGVGLGKTHLIQAIANKLAKNNKNILYVTSDIFISDLMNSLKNGKMEDFKARHRAVDLLIIDDIQFIGGKEATQYEVFNTFNELYAHNKQIVFTSDRPPSAIKTLNDRLKSRFEGGMIVDVAIPEFETRVAILKSKCMQKNFELTDDIIYVIAQRIKSNVRELEGALNKIIARVQLLNTKITPELVDKLIEGGQIHSQRIVSTDTILNIVAEHFHIKKEDLLSKSRKKDIAVPRQIAMYLIREELKLTFPNIGEALGGKDHSTVMHSWNKIKKDLASNYTLEQDIAMIKNKLYNEENPENS
ncbi:chromosomal replication initiator protein DnaA [bacterium]|nr:chromosomal replication initiator protein DnaA [Candidatus Elulimicrobium humile]